MGIEVTFGGGGPTGAGRPGEDRPGDDRPGEDRPGAEPGGSGALSDASGPAHLASRFPARKKMRSGGVKIAPSILSADFTRLGEQVREAEAGGAEVIHIDVMDGHFVPNITIGPTVVEWVRKVTDLPLDVHLMISRPNQYLAAFIEAGADMISFHLEAVPEPESLIQDLRDVGVAAGLAINPDMPLSRIEPFLPTLDYVLLMSVFPGFSGQGFIPESLGRVRDLAKMIEQVRMDTGRQVELEVDGGIKQMNIAEVVESGATMIVAGSAVFPSNAKNRAAELRSLAEEGLARAGL